MVYMTNWLCIVSLNKIKEKETKSIYKKSQIKPTYSLDSAADSPTFNLCPSHRAWSCPSFHSNP